MPELAETLVSVLSHRFAANSARVRELAATFTEEQFWDKPFPYGNSFGHLVLHLTGNLSYYIGSQIAETGYVRERPREFTDAEPPSKEEALQRFDATIAMVIARIQEQAPEDWCRAYSAVGTSSANRLDMVIQCAAHMQHHIGQMIYLVHEWVRQTKSK